MSFPTEVICPIPPVSGEDWDTWVGGLGQVVNNMYSTTRKEYFNCIINQNKIQNVEK